MYLYDRQDKSGEVIGWFDQQKRYRRAGIDGQNIRGLVWRR